MAELPKLVTEIKNRIRMGEPKELILNRLVSSNKDISSSELLNLVNSVVESFGNYDFIQQIMRSRLVQNTEARECFIVDPVTRTSAKVLRELIDKTLSPKLDISDKYYNAKFTYDPFRLQQFYKENGRWHFNEYQPPTWQSKAFYDNEPVPRLDVIPARYKKFLLHLVDSDILSYEYVLDWLANALQNRNFCILTTIGNEGIGKGRLGDIMKGLVGTANFGETGNKIVAERFNSMIKNKRIVYCDEVSVKGPKEEERLKALVNNAVEVEAKGKDAENVVNYASFYLSSNTMDSIKPYAGNRRYSIVNLTDQRLDTIMNVPEIKQLTEQKNIDELARFLYYRPVDEDKMIKVFTSKRTEDIRSTGLSPWQDYVLDVIAPDNIGKTLSIDEVNDLLEKSVSHSARLKPGKKAYKDLEALYPGKLRVCKPIKDGKQIWSVKFLSEGQE